MMSHSRRTWMPRDRWDALVRGEACPVCAEVAGAGQHNNEGYFVADLQVSRCGYSASRMYRAAAFCCTVATCASRMSSRTQSEAPFSRTWFVLAQPSSGCTPRSRSIIRFWGITCRICMRMSNRGTTAIPTRVEQSIQHQASR